MIPKFLCWLFGHDKEEISEPYKHRHAILKDRHCSRCKIRLGHILVKWPVAVFILFSLLLNAQATTITKGLIGEQDQNKYDGVNPTFTRQTSTGGTITLNKIGYEVDALMVYGGGVNYTDTTIQSALTAIGTTQKATILLRPGTWVFSASHDWSAYTNIVFKMPIGAVISHSAHTLTIYNQPEVGAAYNTFLGAGTVTILNPYAGAITGIGIQGPAGPPGMNPRGTWTSGEDYAAQDIMVYSGNMYRCILDITNSTTTPNLDTSHFELFFPLGIQGSPGAPGGNLGFTNIYAIENFANLSTAISTIGSSVSSLVVDTPQTLSANLTIPSTLNLIIKKAGIITVATGETLTINGSVEIGNYQAFNCQGTGSLVFGDKVSNIKSTWWGN